MQPNPDSSVQMEVNGRITFQLLKFRGFNFLFLFYNASMHPEKTMIDVWMDVVVFVLFYSTQSISKILSHLDCKHKSAKMWKRIKM